MMLVYADVGLKRWDFPSRVVVEKSPRLRYDYMKSSLWGCLVEAMGFPVASGRGDLEISSVAIWCFVYKCI